MKKIKYLVHMLILASIIGVEAGELNAKSDEHSEEQEHPAEDPHPPH